MQDIINTFHIDWRLMIAQIFNFAVVFFLLYKIAAKPLRKLIADRTAEITGGLENAEQAKKSLALAEENKKAIELEARKKANEIATHADEEAKMYMKEVEQKAEEHKQMIVDNGRVIVEKERDAMVQTLNKETAEAVVMSVEKILMNSINAKKGETIIKEILAKN
jgi:F-type H+-transporting ATPase subunit b